MSIDRLHSVFQTVLEAETADRTRVLAQICAGEPELQARVAALIAAHEQSEGPLADTALGFLGRSQHSDAQIFKPGEGLVGGRFSIVRFIGRGGMGEVYEAVDEELGRRIAIKTIRAGGSANAETVTRFRREIQMALQVTHQNVCRTYDVHRHKRDDGRELAFLTMEYLDGETLAARLLRQGPLSPALSAEILLQLCRGLRSLHRAKVIHRDLKPGNVMLCPSLDGELRVVLTDFGLARREIVAGEDGEPLTLTGNLLGTPGYMAPEQFQGRPTTAASDVYALGVIASEMLTNHRVTSGKELVDAPPGMAAARWPQGWRETIAKCLNPEPELRPSLDTIERIAARQADPSGQAIVQAVDDETLLERPPFRLLTTRRSLLGGLALAGVAGMSWWVRRRPPSMPTPNNLAMGDYLRGRRQFEKRDPISLRLALGSFEEAIEKDEQFGWAYAGVADCYSALADFAVEPSIEVLPRAVAAAERSVELAPDSAQTWASLGLAQGLHPWSGGDAAASFDRALQIDPNHGDALHWYATHMAKHGDSNSGVELLVQATRTDPTSAPNRMALAWQYYFGGDLEQASLQLDRILKTDPTFWPIFALLSLVRYAQGEIRIAGELAQKAPDEFTADYDGQTYSYRQYNIATIRAFLQARAGQPEVAEARIAEFETVRKQRPFLAYQIGALQNALGRSDLAIESLDRAFEEQDCALLCLPFYPYYEDLAGHPVHRRIRIELQLPDVAITTETEPG